MNIRIVIFLMIGAKLVYSLKDLPDFKVTQICTLRDFLHLERKSCDMDWLGLSEYNGDAEL